MPRFSDEWVVDRVLFDYVSGGSCACCGISHSLFLPNGTMDCITSMTDLETDQMNAEIDILSSDLHPWPKVLRDQIWCDRVKLKQKLKSSIAKYTNFWSQHGAAFTEWLFIINNNIDYCTESENDKNRDNVKFLQRCLQMSRDELTNHIQQEYSIHSAYMVVLTAAMDQVAHFQETKYPYDSLRCSSTSHMNTNSDNDHHAELRFEEILQFGRMTGFMLPIMESTTKDSTLVTSSIRQDVLQILLDRIRTLGNTKLLGRGASTSTTGNPMNIDDDDNDNDDDELEDVDDIDNVDGPTTRPRKKQEARSIHTSTPSPSSSTFTKCGIPTPSFQSDRRMVRLILARYWADLLIQRYYADTRTQIC